jgi:hypothetical protein
MVTVPAGFVVDLNTETEGTTSIGIRRALATLFRQAAPGVAEPGRLADNHFVVAGSASGMEYTVTGGGVVLVRDSTNGAYLVGMPSTVTVDTDASSGVNPRIDRVYVRQPDPALDGAGVDVQFTIDVAIGEPAASPAVPAIPSGALELARKVIAAGATNTTSGAAFTNIAPVTGLNFGGNVPISLGGTGASTEIAALNNLGLYPQSSQPAVSPPGGVRIWFKTT